MMTIKRNQRVSMDFYIMHLMRFQGFGRLGCLDPGPTPPLKIRGGRAGGNICMLTPPGTLGKNNLGSLTPDDFF